MKDESGRFYGMSNSRLVQVWFGIVGVVAGFAMLLSGVITADKAQAANQGISITIAHTAPAK